MIAIPESWRHNAMPGEIVRGRPQGDGLMRSFAIYVATGVLVGFLLVAALCLLGLVSGR